MKKRLLLALSVALYGSIANAQTLMPKFGTSLSTLDFEAFDAKNKIGIVGGVGLEIQLSTRLFIQPEILFAQKGYGFDLLYEDFFGNYESNKVFVTINYLELPILTKIRLGSFYVNGGPSICYGLGGAYRAKDSAVLYNKGKVKFGERPEDTQDLYFDNAIDVGVQIGGGYRLKNILIVDVRYGFGLIDLSDSGKAKNRSFQCSIGVPISVGKK